MTAREMFEELGYELHTNNELHITYRNKKDNIWVEIFPLAETYNIHTTCVLTKELHLAITQLMKELGWIE